MDFVLATKNAHKKIEFDRLFARYGFQTVLADTRDVEETGETFEENAYLKALVAMKETGMPAIADDSGLEIDALGGRPGVYSARYAGENATDEEKNNKVLREMIGQKSRRARFVCAICCVFPNGDKVTAAGYSGGEIAYEPGGKGGFGYDPIFISELGMTFAELSDVQKDSISHRARAILDLKNKLNQYLNNQGVKLANS